jgi:uncharacterized protein (DUF362 family)
MDPIVGVVHGTDKLSCFKELLELTRFDTVLMDACKQSKKTKAELRIVIKPNMMVFVNQKDWRAVVTDHELVEYLIDHLIAAGFSNIAICESRTDVSTMLKNRNVEFIAGKIGYDPKGRYRIVDLTLESQKFSYVYEDDKGKMQSWRDVVGQTWKEADFRISFAKAKTHEHDWLTLGVKNVYGCFPSPQKICKYHIREEVPDVTARSLRNFPVHFSFVDAWIASDGLQGYKIAHPRPLNMLFGGDNLVAVDIEIFKRAGFAKCPSHMVRKAVKQLYSGNYPQYTVEGDKDTHFAQLGKWENIEDETVRVIDRREEVYINWGLLNLKPAAEHVDYKMFPAKNVLFRIAVWFMKILYRILAPLGVIEKMFK